MTKSPQEGWLEGGIYRYARQVTSPNYNHRPSGCAVSTIVIHNISLPPNEFGGHAVEALFTNRLDPDEHPYYQAIAHVEVSAHFYIRRDGELIQFVGCNERAWHAGQSEWMGVSGCNDYSIGIELEGCDTQPFTEAQYSRLVSLLPALCNRYPIRAIVGHEHIAPGRKTDPGPCFEWERLHQILPEISFPSRG